MLGTLSQLAPLQTLEDNVSTVAGAFESSAKAATSGIVGPVSTLEHYVIIILGLILIVAGLFQFDRTRELVVSGAKAAAGAATVA